MSKLVRSLSFGRKKKNPSKYLDALSYLEERNMKTDETKVLEAIDLYNKISELEYESNLSSLPNVPNKHQQDIASLTMELNKLEEILSQKREKLSELKSVVMYPSVPKDVNEQKIQNLKAQLELLDRPEQMKKLHNYKGKLIRLIEDAEIKAKNKIAETVSNGNKIRLAKMKQELGLLLKDEKINDMFQKKMRQQIQEDESIKEATELLAEHGFEGGKRRKKRKTKKNKKNKTKKGKKFRKVKKYTRK